MGEHKIHKPADYTSEDPILLIGPLSSNFSNVFSITFLKKKKLPSQDGAPVCGRYIELSPLKITIYLRI